VPADYSLEEGAERYNWVARYTLAFLNAYREHDEAAVTPKTHTGGEGVTETFDCRAFDQLQTSR
jgi:hypothetical protein